MLELIEDKEDTDYLEECIIRQVCPACDARTCNLLRETRCLTTKAVGLQSIKSRLKIKFNEI